MDVGFDIILEPPHPPLKCDVNGKKVRVKTIVNRKRNNPMKFVNGVGDQMGVNYVSDELYNSDYDTSNTKKGPNYDKFRMDDLENNYKFKVGLEFTSLDEFKEAVIELSILNGRELRFVKNDKVIVRVIPNGKCGFSKLVSKKLGIRTLS